MVEVGGDEAVKKFFIRLGDELNDREGRGAFLFVISTVLAAILFAGCMADYQRRMLELRVDRLEQQQKLWRDK